MRTAANKIIDRSALRLRRNRWKKEGCRVVFTNGCFDLLHPGHVSYLEKARALGDLLVVGLNNDESVRRLKGARRPVMPLRDRCLTIGGLESVDFVTVFEEDTPLKIIQELLPDVLVKGGDWTKDRIVGRGTVEAAGGKVISIGFEEGYSTTGIIERIRNGRE